MSGPYMARVREILRRWGTYEYREDGERRGYWWEQIPVDDLSDEEVLRIAEQIGKEKA